MDLHIFADPDPGSQNLADPTDPDPKHCLIQIYFSCHLNIYPFQGFGGQKRLSRGEQYCQNCRFWVGSVNQGRRI